MTDASPGRLVTKATLAILIDHPEKTIDRWVAAGMPTIGMGKGRRFDIAHCFAWYGTYKGQELAKAGNPNADIDWRERKERAEAMLAELEVAKERGVVVNIDDYKAEITAILEQLDRALNSIPTTWAQHIVGITTQRAAIDILTKRKNLLLDEMNRGDFKDDVEVEAGEYNEVEQDDD